MRPFVLTPPLPVYRSLLHLPLPFSCSSSECSDSSTASIALVFAASFVLPFLAKCLFPSTIGLCHFDSDYCGRLIYQVYGFYSRQPILCYYHGFRDLSFSSICNVSRFFPNFSARDYHLRGFYPRLRSLNLCFEALRSNFQAYSYLCNLSSLHCADSGLRDKCHSDDQCRFDSVACHLR